MTTRLSVRSGAPVHDAAAENVIASDTQLRSIILLSSGNSISSEYTGRVIDRLFKLMFL
jgi:hypothetical protein